MILFHLRCGAGHEFEAWFKDGAAYEQRAAGALTCPLCGDGDVAKAPMAPRINRARSSDAMHALQAEVARKVQELQKQVEQHCDYVGERFPEEARRIHYGEVEARDIYGEASDAEAEALNEEGVTFQRVPWLTRTNS